MVSWYRTAAESDHIMAYLTVVPGFMSVIGCTCTFFMCYLLGHNYEYFPTKIVMRICFSVGAYSLFIAWHPDPDHGFLSSSLDVFPVITDTCYVQSALVIGFENLSSFWQCCLIHCVYEVGVKKNLRPEDLLVWYDNWALTFALAFALLPWAVTGYGWQWYGRCKYNTHETGTLAAMSAAVSHVFILTYTLGASVKMYIRLSHEEVMTVDYRLLPAIKRRWNHQLKYIWISWAFVACRIPGLIINLLDGIQYLSTGNLLVRPDEFPFIILALESIANDFFGWSMFVIFCVCDFNKVRTRCVQTCICLKHMYCCNKSFKYDVEGRTISNGDISDAKEKDDEVYDFVALSKQRDPLASPRSPPSPGHSFAEAPITNSNTLPGHDSTRFSDLLMTLNELERLDERKNVEMSEEEDTLESQSRLRGNSTNASHKDHVASVQVHASHKDYVYTSFGV